MNAQTFFTYPDRVVPGTHESCIKYKYHTQLAKMLAKTIFDEIIFDLTTAVFFVFFS